MWPHNRENTGQGAGVWEGDNVYGFALVQFEILIKCVQDIQEMGGPLG